MAYFPNGTSGISYEAKYCDHCVHKKPDDGGCAVMLAHLMHNYEDDKRDILNLLIPMKGIEAKQCSMFHPWDAGRCTETPDMFPNP